MNPTRILRWAGALAVLGFVVLLPGMAMADNCDLKINPLDCQNTAWVTGGAAALAGAAAAAAASQQQKKQDQTVQITSPTDQDIIALTNARLVTPQVQPAGDPAERRPAARRLRVTGTATNSPTVTVNGRQVGAGGGNWQTELDIAGPGPLQITAVTQDGKGQHAITVHLIEVVIDPPAENAVVPLVANPAPGPPAINAVAQVVGHPNAQAVAQAPIAWQLRVGGYFRTRNGAAAWNAYTRDFAGNANAPNAFQPVFDELVGGWARLIATATVPGVVDGPAVVSDPRWFDIRGTNAAKADVQAFIRAQAPNLAAVLIQIMCHESLGHDFLQFRPNPERREPQDKRVPADLRPNRQPLRPVYGAPPAGIGIAQVDPAQFPAQHWDWHANVTAGIAAFQQKVAGAARLAANEQARVEAERVAAERMVNQARAAQNPPGPRLTIPRVAVPALTPDQLRREQIRRYNGGRNYRFDARVVVSGDALNAQVQGGRAWVEDPGTWESEAAWRNRGGVQVPRQWNPVAQDRLGYVNQVEQCQP